ncbi:transcriptional regulator [Streptomyces nogalater]|uniref:Transcriptional regulator n=1 Tax=Streptomyces nogalater TaxID=38314 RepID=A0ABW0WBR1_STRNO
MAVPPRVGREANERLRAVMEAAGCSSTGLARRVNACGAEQGLDLRYDKTSVARWLQGQQPRGRAPDIIAEALTRKLGRTVTVDDIGMSAARGAASTVGSRFEPTVAGALQQACALWRSDTRYGNLGTRDRLAASVLVQASRDWLIAEPDLDIAIEGVPAVGCRDIAAVRATTAAFSDLDHKFGSGSIRLVAVRYLDSVVSELLAGPYPETTARSLFEAVARLTEVTASMTVDTGQLGLAQRYYIQALRLAQAAGDRLFGGYILASGMGHVALHLGDASETVQLARVAREGTRQRISQAPQVVFYLTEARGHALLGDAAACERAAGQARDLLERDDFDEQERPDWAHHVDRAYMAQELAHCYHDLGKPETAVRWIQEALREDTLKRPRRRVLSLLLLASAELRLGEVARSCGTAAQALALLRGIRSAQCTKRMEEFRSRLEASGHHEEARSLQPAVDY